MLKRLLVIATLFSFAGVTQAADLTGKITIDGSSTVAPITEAVAEEFRSVAPKVRISVGISGTGGGFKKFSKGETDLNDASRPIKDKEAKVAQEHSIEFLELPVAFDGLSVVVSKDSKVSKLTSAQLEKIWNPDVKNQINTWNQVDTKLGNENIKLFGPGPDSGTFDFFTEKILGKSARSRSDYSSSEDDNVIVKGVQADPNALGYFGYAYYLENQASLKALAIDGVAPTEKSIAGNTYPLARRIFVYVSSKSAKRPEVQEFVRFYLKTAPRLAKEVGYLPLPAGEYAAAKKKFDKFVSASTGH